MREEDYNVVIIDLRKTFQNGCYRIPDKLNKKENAGDGKDWNRRGINESAKGGLGVKLNRINIFSCSR